MYGYPSGSHGKPNIDHRFPELVGRHSPEAGVRNPTVLALQIFFSNSSMRRSHVQLGGVRTYKYTTFPRRHSQFTQVNLHVQNSRPKSQVPNQDYITRLITTYDQEDDRPPRRRGSRSTTLQSPKEPLHLCVLLANWHALEVL